jgi:hypothetical protein
MTGLQNLNSSHPPFSESSLASGYSPLYATVFAIMAPEQTDVNVYTRIPSPPSFYEFLHQLDMERLAGVLNELGFDLRN